MAIRENWIMSTLGVVHFILLECHRQTHCADMVLIAIITSNFREFHATYNDYSCPLNDAGGISPWFKCYLKKADISAH